jgi:hypothetical protein
LRRALCAGTLFPALLLGAGPFSFQLTPERLEVHEDGRPVLAYNYGMVLKEGVPESRRRSGYVHPLWAPDGTVVTDDFPRDHYHHRGIFWSWPVVRIGGRTYDLWTIRGIHQKFVRWKAREARRDTARLAVENGWFVGDRQVVREEVEMVVHRTSGHARVLEFELAFEAVAEPVEIGGEQVDRKGYGGFSVRFAPRTGTRIVTEAGVETRDTDMARHRWAQLEALYEGRPVTLRIESDPENPGFPNGWCLRHYGFLGVNYPGLETYTLVPGKPLRLRYRVTVSAGMPSN